MTAAAPPLAQRLNWLIDCATALGEHSALRSSSDETIAYWKGQTDAARAALQADTVAVGVLAANVAAARRERDEAREEQERAELDLAYLANEMVFNGNSIGWIASKADKYKAALGRAWDALVEAGGKCDGSTELADAIRRHADRRGTTQDHRRGAMSGRPSDHDSIAAVVADLRAMPKASALRAIADRLAALAPVTPAGGYTLAEIEDAWAETVPLTYLAFKAFAAALTSRGQGEGS